MEEKQDRTGQLALIRYKGGVFGEEPHDIHMDEPLRVRIGYGRVVKGIDKALQVMEVGDALTLIIPPEEGYGESDPKLIDWYPRSVLDHGYEIKKGTFIMWESNDGLAKRPVYVADAKEDVVLLDRNHPYAGKTLQYWVELVDIK
jgi:peptidylprolyl isomerase